MTRDTTAAIPTLRRWLTPAEIERFYHIGQETLRHLGSPDRVTTVVFVGSRPGRARSQCVRLFDRRRIEPWVAEREAAPAAQVRWALTVEIELLPIPSDIHAQARRYYGGRADPRQVIAFIRHQLTNYDQLVDQLNHRGGDPRAHRALQRRVNWLITRRLETAQKGASYVTE